MKYLAVAFMIVLMAVGATYYRYQSLSPCDWIERDLILQTGLPELVIQAKIKAEFLLQGIAEPSPSQCLVEWWRVRRESIS